MYKLAIWAMPDRIIKNLTQKKQTLKTSIKYPGFSLVEMLMALLVASLLLAALAPVMTKRMGENVNVSGVNGGNRLEYSRAYYEDSEWQIPRGVNLINVTAIGGGGAGGGASYGFQEFTSTKTGWKVPDGVTKLRVFMVGAGGSGASGGHGAEWAYSDIPALNNAEGEILTSGSYTFANVTPPDSYKAPELDSRCKASNTSNWIIVSNNETIAPETKFTKFGGDNNINVALSKVTLCGGGGGVGGYNGRAGGSGGIISEKSLQVTASPVAISIGVGAPGAKGEGLYFAGTSAQTGTVKGGAGGWGWKSYNGAAGAGGSLQSGGGNGAGAGGGSGGGGATGIAVGGIEVVVGGGGGGGGGAHGGAGSIGRGGDGGQGGGPNPGDGGKKTTIVKGVCTSGVGGSKQVSGASGVCDNVTGNATGGGGGGGIGGVGGGTGGTLNSIFGANNCNSDKPGAIHLWYSTSSVPNGLKCQYYIKSNSGAGGGAGQVWIGEIDVTPGQTIDFNVGTGGSKPSGYGENGKNGNPTYIVSNGTTYKVSGGLGGKYEADDTYINNSKGLGGGISTGSLGQGSRYINWTNVSYGTGGANGENGTTPANGAGGGKGGNSYKFDGTLAQGGNGGGAQADGTNAPSSNYGAGGGGGGGVTVEGNNPGLGGSGANGYIYIEWGSTNGGGGASGEIVTKTNVFVQPETVLKIFVGKGGKAGAIETVKNGVTGYFGKNGENGTDSYIQGMEGSKEKVLLTAKGGLGGLAGASVHGFGGNANEAISSSIKGETGTDDYGGNGGNITEEILPLISTIKELSGFGGCGGSGNSPNPNACYSGLFSSAQGSQASGIGNGGGGGAVKGGAAYKGGDGAPGTVIIEWSN